MFGSGGELLLPATPEGTPEQEREDDLPEDHSHQTGGEEEENIAILAALDISDGGSQDSDDSLPPEEPALHAHVDTREGFSDVAPENPSQAPDQPQLGEEGRSQLDLELVSEPEPEVSISGEERVMTPSERLAMLLGTPISHDGGSPSSTRSWRDRSIGTPSTGSSVQSKQIHSPSPENLGSLEMTSSERLTLLLSTPPSS